MSSICSSQSFNLNACHLVKMQNNHASAPSFMLFPSHLLFKGQNFSSFHANQRVFRTKFFGRHRGSSLPSKLIKRKLWSLSSSIDAWITSTSGKAYILYPCNDNLHPKAAHSTNIGTVPIPSSFDEADHSHQFKSALPPSSLKGIIHFIGSAWSHRLPHLVYHSLLEPYAKRGFLVIATSYSLLDDDFVVAAEDSLSAFENAIIEIFQFSLSNTSSHDEINQFLLDSKMKIIGWGDKEGATVHMILSALFTNRTAYQNQFQQVEIGLPSPSQDIQTKKDNIYDGQIIMNLSCSTLQDAFLNELLDAGRISKHCPQNSPYFEFSDFQSIKSILKVVFVRLKSSKVMDLLSSPFLKSFEDRIFREKHLTFLPLFLVNLTSILRNIVLNASTDSDQKEPYPSVADFHDIVSYAFRTPVLLLVNPPDEEQTERIHLLRELRHSVVDGSISMEITNFRPKHIFSFWTLFLKETIFERIWVGFSVNDASHNKNNSNSNSNGKNNDETSRSTTDSKGISKEEKAAARLDSNVWNWLERKFYL